MPMLVHKAEKKGHPETTVSPASPGTDDLVLDETIARTDEN